MAYTGSCHCGAVAFTVDREPPTEANNCNCSHCRRKGFLWNFVPATAFTLTTGEDALRSYRFNKRAIDHLFCATCGTQAFARGSTPNGDTVAVNLRCVPALELETLTVSKVDGASK